MRPRIGMMIGAIIVLAGLHGLVEGLDALGLVRYPCTVGRCFGWTGLLVGPICLAVGVGIMWRSWQGEDMT